MTAKTSLRERIATLRAQKEAAASKFSAKEAKTRVAASWTIAKTLLPSAPSEVQYKLASSLLGNTTNALTAMLRQAAVNAHYTKLAEKFEEMHKVELNELIENPSLLTKMQNEVEKELKGEPKNASKTAACKCGEEGCEECKTAKTAAEGDENLVEDNATEDKGENSEIPAPPPADNLMDESEESDESADAAPEEPTSPAENKKDILTEQIQTLKDDVAALEEEVNEGEELDFSAIFDEENMEDKANNLAGEGEEEFDGDIEASSDFFGPSSAKEMEGALDADGMEFADASDFFSHNAAVDSMDDLFAGETKTAAKEDIVAPGEMGEELSKATTPDSETDHEDNILFEILGDIKDVAYEDGEYKRTTEPKFEKAASKKKTAAPAEKKRPIRSLGNVKTASPQRSAESAALAALVFPDEMFG